VGKKSTPAAPDMSGYTNAYKELGDKYLQFSKEQFQTANDRYNALQPYAQRLMDNQSELMTGQNKAQALALDEAQDSYDYNKNTYRPLEQKLISQAQDWNTDAERERMASQAGANVQQAVDNQRSQSMRALERMGVNPNSGRFAALMAGTGLDAARMQAQAQNTATIQARDAGFARLAGVTGMGRGLSAQSIAGINASSGAAGAGSNAASVGSGVMGSADRVGQMYTQNGMQGFQGAGGAIAGGMNATNSGFNNQLAASAQEGQMWAGVGALAGRGMTAFLADGGEVRGPGTGTSDDVPAVNTSNGNPIRLSNGEYVLPAETVRRIGKNKLDRIVEKTNGKPANGARRQALEA